MKKILVGGRFNILHAGHIYFLKKAKSFGDHLTVVVANDKTILQDKKHVFFSQTTRKNVVQAVKYVDKVVIGYSLKGQEGYLKIIEKERPDSIVLGYDQGVDIAALKKTLLSRHIVCDIKRVKKLPGFETHKIMKIKK